jgi:DNA-binding transcriptional MerR regulator
VTSIVLTIGELARKSGLTTHTIRFYESTGVLKPSSRAANGHRRYQPGDVLWLEFVLKLKQAGMPLTEIKQYADLREMGDLTLQQRLAMLELHRDRLASRMSELFECSNVLDAKIRTYRKLVGSANETAGNQADDTSKTDSSAPSVRHPLRAGLRKAERD